VSNAPAQPREGLPPCVSIAFFEGRRVFMRNIRECKHGWGAQGRKEQIVVCADLLSEKGIAPDGYHPDHSMPWGDGSNFLLLWTNDPAEAQAAFARGAEWVRTGEGP
jgi:hypothetical protein